MSRRRFLQQSSALCASSLLLAPGISRSESPPEVKKIRLIHFEPICLAPGYLAEDLLYAEGFEEVEYVEVNVNTTGPYIASGRVDFWTDAAPSLVNQLSSNDGAIAIGGIHSGCYELLANARVKTIRDLHGKSVAISTRGSTEHIFVSSIAAYVGLDPRKDIDWQVMNTSERTMEAFIEGRVDAFFGFAPQPQELRKRKIGHVILNTTHDRPWSQYFCCMVTANREFATRNPIATKRALRAFLRAADICANEPARAARFLVDKGYTRNYDVALEVLASLPYRRWRDANPEDTIRFHALRLHEGGIIQTSPQRLIEHGTDWRFLNELKRELKA